jgi:hypothetical protein
MHEFFELSRQTQIFPAHLATISFDELPSREDHRASQLPSNKPKQHSNLHLREKGHERHEEAVYCPLSGRGGSRE